MGILQFGLLNCPFDLALWIFVRACVLGRSSLVVLGTGVASSIFDYWAAAKEAETVVGSVELIHSFLIFNMGVSICLLVAFPFDLILWILCR